MGAVNGQAHGDMHAWTCKCGEASESLPARWQWLCFQHVPAWWRSAATGIVCECRAILEKGAAGGLSTAPLEGDAHGPCASLTCCRADAGGARPASMPQRNRLDILLL